MCVIRINHKSGYLPYFFRFNTAWAMKGAADYCSLKKYGCCVSESADFLCCYNKSVALLH